MLCAEQDTIAFQAKHSDVFPSVKLLQHKIREVRQKVLPAGKAQQSPALAPSTPLLQAHTSAHGEPPGALSAEASACAQIALGPANSNH